MPEKEFELYLSLLVKLLRLSPDQKTSIERELRDHFEERFESLVRRGTPRDEAIRRTLDEFGDVAGLANEFTNLSRRHIRRRIMQGATATAGLAAAIVIYATLFRGPDPAVGPGPNVVANETALENSTEPATVDTPTIAETDIEWIDPGRFVPEPLAEMTEVQFAGTPLREVINYIREIHALDRESRPLPVFLDTPELSLDGISGDEEISIDMEHTPLHAVLDVILRNVGESELAWMPKSEVLQITTRNEADSTNTTKYYNVRDLLAAGYSMNALIETVHYMTEGPWESVDGMGGTVAEFGDLLVVKQCERTHIDVACTLAGLRSTHREARVGELEQHAGMYAALEQPTQLQFTHTPLREIVNYIREIHSLKDEDRRLPMFLDTPVLGMEGITGDEEISIDVSGIKLSSALDLMLASVNEVSLDYVIRDGGIWVTTRKAAMDEMESVFYDVSDITDNEPAQMEKLEEVIPTQTRGPWEYLDGIGGVIDAPLPGRLACRQSRRAQAEVREVLAAVRASIEASGGDRSSLTQVSTRLETRFYRMDSEAAEHIAKLLPDLIEPGTWREYPDSPRMFNGSSINPAGVGTIHLLAAGRMLLNVQFQAGESKEHKHKLRNFGPNHPETIESKEQLADGPTEQSVVIPVSVLVITHKPAVLRKVKDLLNSLLSEHSAWSGRNNDQIKFIAPGFQEGQWPVWNTPLGTSDSPVIPAAEDGFGGLPPGAAPGGYGYGAGGRMAPGFSADPDAAATSGARAGRGARPEALRRGGFGGRGGGRVPDTGDQGGFDASDSAPDSDAYNKQE